MKIPKILHRTTKHAKPKHQLYQPGFNHRNSCWLDGSWVTVPAEGFAQAAKKHQKLYAHIHQALKKQHYRDEPTPVEAMNPAQRQAWDFFNGQRTIDCRHPDGSVGPVRVELGGDKPKAESLAWMREKGFKAIPLAKQPDGSVEDQRGLVPPDLLSDDQEAVNVWQNIVKRNRDRAEEMSRALAFDPGPMGDFGIQIALHGLTELEESIMRGTLRRTLDLLETPEEVKARYIVLRQDLEKSLGDKFRANYERARASHNECARANLENSKGHLYCFVLPKFNPDGTHEAIGPRDYPWAYPKEYALP